MLSMVMDVNHWVCIVIIGYVWLLTVNNVMNGYHFLMYIIDCY